MRIRVILWSLLALFPLVIILQNTEVIETRLLFATIAMPRAALLFIAFASGFLAGAGAFLLGRHRGNRKAGPASS